MLSWLATHPWVEVVTTDDLTDDDVVGELDLLRASDPYIEEQWRLATIPPPRPRQRAGLRHLVRRVGRDTARPGSGRRCARSPTGPSRRSSGPAADDPDDGDELLLLARLYFLMCLHESQWSKRPRIEPGSEGFDHCENFVAAESLQLRNAHVYLAARHWARWARSGGTGGAPRRRPGGGGGRGGRVSPAAAPPWWRGPSTPGCSGTTTRCPTSCSTTSTRWWCVDRNGGRITHLFAMVGGRPVSVSGTFKAYQFVDADWAVDSGVECDGLVLQNTVWSPNHGYVACDVEASRGTVGSRPPNDRGFDLYYPDNFNLYDEVPGADGRALR